jgi:hypothetical protein
MSPKQKGALIHAIIAQLRFAAKAKNKPFSDGDLFFTLAFRSDDELKQIAKLCGV